ncbi:gamma-glutamyl-gamma-aminobutyraldehyde dehydrogenase [Marinospirillum celere]|uniref:Gamma-glutamyl-gamma-aminobutyraldehyde dehydrogenase n=1 Tax=Marinospirillum celere TaxID=1122252 RepID=A0A1I1E704_9GAMM|nr:aldehyde dehydrogenase [Marinospirillum celere]SFB82456.1 gamma-glutamyl-gamma-aminobutyraldehyde dehydrogenase [Marinospirillum celere]
MTSPTSREEWQQLAKTLELPSQAFINGQYVDALSGATFRCESPLDGRQLISVASCQEEDVDLAVKAARKSFQEGNWRLLPPAKRKKILLKFADLLIQHRDELALLETLDMGKPIRFSQAVDIPAAAQAFRWTAEAIDKVYGELAPTPANQLGMITREPVGVVACIVPWNFPLLMASWKLAPALAMGNSVLLKPSEKSPLSALRVAALAQEAGIPDGVFNVLPGLGASAGRALALHQDVDCLAFTGSTATAKQLLIYSGESNMKRVWLEAGGKSPNIVFADAPDLKKAARAAAQAVAFNQGQVCTAGTRLLVEESIKDEFIAEVKQALAKWQPGDPLDPNTTFGALADQQQFAKVMDYIALAKQEGAQLELGGQPRLQETGGYFTEPTLFSEVKNSMRVAQEEVFGPLLAVISFKTREEAVAIANDTIYGLAAAVWTKDIDKAHLTAQELRAGSVWINNYDGGDMTAPFGGFKQSGQGRDKSLHAFDKYTEIKATWLTLN